MIDPLSLGLTAAGGIGTLYNLFKGNKYDELPADFWKKYYNPARIHARVAPVKQSLQNQAGAEMSEIAETYGGRGTLTGQGHRKAKDVVYGRMSDVLAREIARVSEDEMEQATEFGIGDWQRKYQEELAKKSGIAQLSGSLLGFGLQDVFRQRGMKQANEMLLPLIEKSLLTQALTAGKDRLPEKFPLWGGKSDELTQMIIEMYTNYLQNLQLNPEAKFGPTRRIPSGATIGGE